MIEERNRKKRGVIMSNNEIAPKELNLVKLTWPIFVETLLFMTLGFVDTFMLSTYSDFAAGAVGSTSLIMGFVNLLFQIVSGGSAVLLAQYLGAKDNQSAMKTMTAGLLVNFAFGIFISVMLVLFSDTMLNLMKVSPDLMPFAKDYMNIVGGFMFIQALLNTLTVFIRTYGQTKQVMYITVFMNIINVIGDALLIFGWLGLPVLGVKGVAIATVFARSLAFVILLVYFYIAIFKKLLQKSKLSLSLPIAGRILKIGAPAAAESISFNLTMVAMTAILFSEIGQEAAITRVYVSKIYMFALAFSYSIGQATQIMVGHQVGAKNFDKAYQIGIKNYFYSIPITVACGLALIIFNEPLMRLFTDSPSIIAIGATALIVDAFLEPGRSFNLVFVFALRGAGDVVFPAVVGAIFGWGFRIGIGYIIAVTLGFGLPGFVFASLLDEWIRGIIMLMRWRSKKWIKEKAITEIN